MDWKRLKASAAALTIAAPLAFGASGALAHAKLVKASPAASTTVGAPQKLQLQFSEKLEPKFSSVELLKAGAPVAVVSAVSGKDRKTLEAAPKAPLAPGAYKVTWRIVSADGHKMTGDYNFTVK
jgi:methionine-rich copper-binding protein CopC